MLKAERAAVSDRGSNATSRASADRSRSTGPISACARRITAWRDGSVACENASVNASTRSMSASWSAALDALHPGFGNRRAYR